MEIMHHQLIKLSMKKIPKLLATLMRSKKINRKRRKGAEVEVDINLENHIRVDIDLEPEVEAHIAQDITEIEMEGK